MIRKLLRFLFSRLFLVGLLLALQLAVIVWLLVQASTLSFFVTWGLTAISLLVVLYIVGKPGNPSYKLAWIIPILLFPVLGGLLYLLITFQSSTRQMQKALERSTEKSQLLVFQDPAVMGRLRSENLQIANRARYLEQQGFPIYQHTTAVYLSPGEEKFAALVAALKEAKQFIFLEYFIIQQGIMWDTILEILAEKARQGVDVRVMYDAMGCLMLLPEHYDKQLETLGIKCQIFNQFRPVLSTIQNNRDHRKIAIIDGHTAFTGGINLADEYINAYEKHGVWKDASIVLHGEAVWSLTVLFLQLWRLYRPEEHADDSRFLPRACHAAAFASDGFIQPYGDSPLDSEHVAEFVYLDIIHKAKQYLYINTPYLIIDQEMLVALCMAAKSGVDVRIVTPHHWDKWLVHMTTRSYYAQLIQAGVRIYEFTPGFMHSKTFVSDDTTATVGSVNLDYRSLYLHFECGVWLYRNAAVLQVKDDFLKTLDQCEEWTLAQCKRQPFFIRQLQKVLQLFAPLM